MLTDSTAKVVSRQHSRHRNPATRRTLFLPFEFPPNEWQLLLLTYDSFSASVYLGGEQVHVNNLSSNYIELVHPTDLPNLCIGFCGGGSQFNGHSDDLTLWNRSLQSIWSLSVASGRD